jgi:hypothetical protein
MAYQVRYCLEVVWIPDGAGPVSMASAQKLRLGTIDFAGLTVQNPTISTPGQPTSYQVVTGGDAPAQSDFNNALTGSTATPTGGAALDLANAIAANLVRIQGFATGGG